MVLLPLSVGGVQLTTAERSPATAVGAGGAVGTFPDGAPRMEVRAGYQTLAIFCSPLALGCSPSSVSVATLKPVYWSTRVTGDCAVVSWLTSAGRSELNCCTWASVVSFEMILASTMRTSAFPARIWPMTSPTESRTDCGVVGV